MKPRATAKSDGGLFRAWGGAAMALMVATALLLASCGSQGGQQGSGDGGAEEKEKAGEEAGQTRSTERVTVQELTNNPSEFYGQSVTVSGQVVEAVEPGVFRIDSEGDQLLVVALKQVPNVNEGDTVRATGEVRKFKIEEVRQKVDRGIDDEYFGDYKGDPAVLAYSAEVIS